MGRGFWQATVHGITELNMTERTHARAHAHTHTHTRARTHTPLNISSSLTQSFHPQQIYTHIYVQEYWEFPSGLVIRIHPTIQHPKKQAKLIYVIRSQDRSHLWRERGVSERGHRRLLAMRHFLTRLLVVWMSSLCDNSLMSCAFLKIYIVLQ